MLVPPGRPRPIVLKSRAPCPVSEAIAVRRKGGRTVLTVNGEALARQAPGWLYTWSWHAEESGCVPAGEREAVAEQLLDAAPLALGTRYLLLHPNHARSGYVDLGAHNRLEVIAPVLRPGAAPGPLAGGPATVTQSATGLTVETQASPDLLGVETAWYAIRDGAAVPLGTAPRRDLFAGVHARFWRLVYKADQTSVILAADSPGEIEAATRSIGDGAPCRNCLEVPRSVAVNPYVAIVVNGSEVRAPVGSTLGAVLRAARVQPEAAMPTLTVGKPFAGKITPVQFDRARPDVLGLVLEGNEVVRW